MAVSRKAKVITPEQLAEPDTEHAHQVALFCWAANEINAGRLLELKYMFAIPNGGERHIIVAGRMKAEGVRRGVPDICLPTRRAHWSGLYIEMKRPRTDTRPAGTVSVEQKEWHAYLMTQGYHVRTCWTWLDARNVIRGYLEGAI